MTVQIEMQKQFYDRLPCRDLTLAIKDSILRRQTLPSANPLVSFCKNTVRERLGFVVTVLSFLSTSFLSGRWQSRTRGEVCRAASRPSRKRNLELFYRRTKSGVGCEAQRRIRYFDGFPYRGRCKEREGSSTKDQAVIKPTDDVAWGKERLGLVARGFCRRVFYFGGKEACHTSARVLVVGKTSKSRRKNSPSTADRKSKRKIVRSNEYAVLRYRFVFLLLFLLWYSN